MIEAIALITASLPILLFTDAIALGNLRDSKIANLSSKAILIAGVIMGSIILISLSYESPILVPTLEFVPSTPILRFDTLSTTMFLVVSIIGFIVLRFSGSYLDGDDRQVAFTQKLVFTIACVLVLVLSANLVVLALAWITTSFGLTGLIQFYKERKRAKLSAQKKFVVARMSDLALLTSFTLLFLQFGSTDLETIFSGIKSLSPGETPILLELSAVFLVISAVIKSVQIPFHGWIIDVMEAPTPVSGLLHAGLLNAGPFLIIRFSYLLDISWAASAILLLIGGVSAIYGTLVYPTQPSVKTGLAYSSVGHMGFSLMLSGMGLYSASLLHLVAHSFYKAHAFLSSGSAIDKKRVNQLNGIVKFKVSIGTTILAFLATCGLYAIFSNVMGESYHRNFQVLVVGGIIVAGVSSYLVRSFGSKIGVGNVLTTIMLSSLVLMAFFTFEGSIAHFLGDQIPTISDPNLVAKGLSALLLAVFIAIIFASTLNHKAFVPGNSWWYTYKQNGFYIHLVFDQFLTSVHRRLIK